MLTRAHDRATVIVDPPEALQSRRRLFAAIAEALDVRLVPSGSVPTAAANAAIVFGRREAAVGLPTMMLPPDRSETRESRVEVSFAEDARIDRALRGASLAHTGLQFEQLRNVAGEDVLARVGLTPVWVYRENLERVAVGISELGASEPLRNRLKSDSFLPLVPIVDFLRRMAPGAFTPASPRAAFLFDDPNLHWTSYGYLNYRRLAADARRFAYHVAFATIPIDTWYASRAAVDLFRSHGDVFSLIIHGNSHVRRELARPLALDARRAMLAQGLRRIERFEHRFGIPVARVMAPPHGACSEAVAAEMPLLGYDALCVSRPYPWLDTPPPGRVLAGWRPAEILASGLPVIPRLHLDADRSEIVLRAFLRQPIIVYGHHGDVRSGLEVLREAAGQVNRVGDVRWTSLEEIVSNSYEMRIEGERLDIRLYTRRATISIPEGIEELTVDWSRSSLPERIFIGSTPQDQFDVSTIAGTTVSVGVAPRRSPEFSQEEVPRKQLWPYLRRGAAEARDRLLPILPRA